MGFVEESGRALPDTPPFRKERERVGHPDCAGVGEERESANTEILRCAQNDGGGGDGGGGMNDGGGVLDRCGYWGLRR